MGMSEKSPNRFAEYRPIPIRIDWYWYWYWYWYYLVLHGRWAANGVYVGPWNPPSQRMTRRFLREPGEIVPGI